ncbi:protease inhibitor I42 family protein [Kitasatospora sp. NPDC057542]|uniref:protease inhibitor I42 family protein n=1 Tax=Streptomycetaceae TaxID=2062 RepID=UPI001CCFDE8C|nr:protease inhibitor I42 family protein [Streptomyces sp. LS1784]
MNPRRPAAPALAAALLTLAACASTGTGPSTPTATSAAPSPATVTVDEHADHTTVKAAVGTTVTLALHSTYWSAATSSAPDVVTPDGAPTTAPSPSCRPGGGCGTVTASFTARAPGTARLTATRTSCGEALNCPPEQRGYEVTVDVSG